MTNERSTVDGAPDRWATELLRAQAAVVAQGSLRDACIASAAEVVRVVSASVAAVLLLDAKGNLVMSGSHGVLDPDPRQPLGAALVEAGHEALDQGRSLCWPPAGARGDPILLAQQRLAAGGSACSIPLAVAGQVTGVLVVQRVVGPLSQQDVNHLEDVAALAAPVIELHRKLELPWTQRIRARASAMSAVAGRRRIQAGVILAAAVGLAVPVPWRISAPARLEGAVQRAVVAASDGFVQQVNARPGDTVQAGQVLVELATQDLELERRRRESELSQHETAYHAAQVRYDRTQMMASRAKTAEAQAMLSIAESNLERARVSAPFDGIVVKGDLSQNLGAPVQKGEILMVLAPNGRFRLLLEVDEADVGQVEPGLSGLLTLASRPGRAVPFTITRIVPVATAVDGRNAFEVEADLRQEDAALRPGLGGIAKVDVGSRSVGGILTWRLVRWLEFAWWSITP